MYPGLLCVCVCLHSRPNYMWYGHMYVASHKHVMVYTYVQGLLGAVWCHTLLVGRHALKVLPLLCYL